MVLTLVCRFAINSCLALKEIERGYHSTIFSVIRKARRTEVHICRLSPGNCPNTLLNMPWCIYCRIWTKPFSILPCTMWQGWELIFPFLTDPCWRANRVMANLIETCPAMYPILQRWCAMQLDMQMAAQGGSACHCQADGS